MWSCWLLWIELGVQAVEPTADQARVWQERAECLISTCVQRRQQSDLPWADAEVCGKAVLWILRHREFYKPTDLQATEAVLQLGESRLAMLERREVSWEQRPGTSVALGYISDLDASVQPYVVTLPSDYVPQDRRRWPLFVVLHGRNAQLHEVGFIQTFEGKKIKEPLRWIQLDVFGRTNNAYRWAGEVDVWEAIAAVKQRYSIDDQRIVLWGFSMGGAGAWHLGVHYPDQWCAVGAGAGFAETLTYLKIKENLPDWQRILLRIYDAADYAANAHNVPMVGYGGELDKQLEAARLMSQRAREEGAEIKLLIGSQTEHKFHPQSWREFLDFLEEAAARGRPAFPLPRTIQFVTYTVKYNTCFWLSIEQQIHPLERSQVQATRDEHDCLHVKTENVSLLQLARGAGEQVMLDGEGPFPLRTAAEGILPGVYYSREQGHWRVLGARESHEDLLQPAKRKRRHLQGPIDDAFMRPFVCVRPSGQPWSEEHAAWCRFQLERFAAEYDKYFRATLPIVMDNQVTEEMMQQKNLVLFGDPGSNSVLARVIDRLPIRWDRVHCEVAKRHLDLQRQAFVLVYPNPLAPARYVVLNSGHTFHEPEFRGSNALLYPRLGDVGIINFSRLTDGRYQETIEWSAHFNNVWEWDHEP
ncbi:MAG: hypothetical protein KatS3mg113_0780 [Planctomycetaceae bacterium]|nr:MAG: hypothetical protein KatS3mg113_0780 [Planctomycetaceae bacterium]